MNIYKLTDFNIIADNNGNKIAELKKQPGGDIYLVWSHDRVSFREIDPNPNEQGLVRVMSITGTGCDIQFRAHQSLSGKQKAKTIIGQAHFSIEDIEFILNRIKNEKQ